jgi:hypothetical protein
LVRRAAFLPALLGALAMGCGASTVDAAEIEGQIEQQLSTATAKVASVSCPDDVESEDGQTFECRAELEGGGEAVVVVTEHDRGDFTYEVKPGTMRLAGSSVEAYLERSLPAGTEVTCAEEITVIAGQTVDCDSVTAGGRPATVSLTWADDAGKVEPGSVETG